MLEEGADPDDVSLTEGRRAMLLLPSTIGFPENAANIDIIIRPMLYHCSRRCAKTGDRKLREHTIKAASPTRFVI